EVRFKPVATREFRAVVEGDGMTPFLVQFFEPLFDPVVDVVGVFRLDLEDDREPRLAVNQGHQAARAGWAEHRVTLKVAQAKPPLNDFRTISDPGSVARFRLFSAARPLAAPPQHRLPMLSVVVVVFDPVVDRLGRYPATRIVRMLLLQPSLDLLG